MSETKESATTTNENVLRPASIGDLYEGLIVEDNIYDSSGDKLLVSAGNTLTEEQIERIHRFNGGSDKIYVTGRTHKAIASKRPNIEIAKRTDIEETTEYTAALANIKTLFMETQSTKKVSQSGYNTVTEDVFKIINSSAPDIVISLVNAIAPVAEHVERHILGVGILSGVLGQWLNLPEDEVKKLILIGLLHDCGHALMPQELLHSPRKFTRLDFEAIKMHPVRTYELLADFPDDIRTPAAAHHERLDGSGYPKKIPAAQIDNISRIIAVADIYEGIVTTRTYRPPRSPFCALSLFSNMASVQIDSNVVNILCEKLPPLLIDKTVTMSDGTIGIIREFCPESIKFPKVEVSKRLISTSESLQCVSMYSDD